MSESYWTESSVSCCCPNLIRSQPNQIHEFRRACDLRETPESDSENESGSKDAIKEALFDAVGIGDLQWSNTLSRAADAALVEIAAGLEAAVLDNYWRRETVEQLLAPIEGRVVEVYCRVDPTVACSRFESRTRHPGHADDERDRDLARHAVVSRTFPLGMLGPVIEVVTGSPVDVAAVAAEVLAARE
jgi:hypothetical protein